MRRASPALAAVALLVLAGCSPSATVPVDGTTTDESEYLQRNAAEIAEQLGIPDPPDVDLVRMITLEEWAPTQGACLRDAGYDVGESADGQGLEYPAIDDPALAADLRVAMYVCELKYPVLPKYMTELSTAQLETLYEYRAGELLECLAREGYSSSSLPPSEAVFVQSGGAWSPYEDISIGDADAKRVFAACPQTPDAVYDR